MESGDKSFGKLNIGERTDGSPLDIPLILMNGDKPGPRLGLFAGIHADEYNGIEALRRVTLNIDPQELSGSMIMVPVANLMSFQARDRISHIDYKNLNRVFPGDPDGSVTDRLAYKLLSEIVSQVDYLIDIHDGGAVLKLSPYAMYYKIGGEVQKRSGGLAQVFGSGLVWENSEEWIAGGKFLRGLSLIEAARKGVPNITVEAGGSGVITEEHVKVLYRGVVNVMKHLGMIKGVPEPAESQELIVEGRWVTPTRGGLLYPIELGSRVAKGDVLARIENLFFEEVERLTAPIEGIVFGVRSQPAINTGEWAVLIGRTKN